MLDTCRNLMGKKVVIILLLILIVGGVAAYFLFSRQATYTFYGTEIISTTASSSQLGTILHQTAWELGDCIIQEGGGKRLPSFHQGGRTWKDNDGKIIASRNITEFDDKNGNHSVIETIAIPGKPRVILLKSDTEDSTMKLANELMRQFRLLKIKRKG
jgi:hypothetical protein